MEEPKSDSRQFPDEKKLPCTNVHTSKSGSRTSSERKPYSQEDTIMFAKTYTNQSHTSDSTTSDGYEADDESYSNYPISYLPSFVLSLRAPGTRPAPRRRKGILDPINAGEDAAFFARANRQFQQRIRDVVRDNEKKAKKEVFEATKESEAVLRAKADAATMACKDQLS
ncbi:hypothetical protein MFRU_007g03370 [Monilinia fructicola]|uniref:Uncharacterized protein n=1 Tax=Monilinia fructicola TaxID=38448 RepID=A0A5M9JH69_MONFR|nr:hypothetical protein EYC84_010340 [Monilinia fructicola]KAG4032434.1 hypothetical protein MFRU_007g03370 [Monilinia fructicola]